MLDRDAAARLLFVEERFDQERGRQDLVPRRIQQISARHVGGADRLAFAAPQAVLDGIGNSADVRMLHDQGLVSQQPEARGIGPAQVAVRHEFMLVEPAFGVDALLVRAKRSKFRVGQKLELGDADAMLAGNDAVQAAGNAHDSLHRAARGVQHGVVVGVHRNIRVHVAVARVHVQGDEYAPLQDALVHRLALGKHLAEGRAGEYAREAVENLGLPAHPDAAVLQPMENASRRIGRLSDPERVQSRPRRRQWRIHGAEKVLPAGAYRGEKLAGFRPAADIDVRSLAGLDLAGEVFVESVEQGQFVADRQFDVDSLYGVGVLAQSIERNDDIFVDLECVGVLRNRGGSSAVEPEFAARLGIHGDEAFARAGVRQAHDVRGRGGDLWLVLADDVAEQHHLRQRAALRFGAVADGAQVALIQMFEAGENGALGLGGRLEVPGDLDDAGNRVARLTEEFQAHGADMLRHAV